MKTKMQNKNKKNLFFSGLSLLISVLLFWSVNAVNLESSKIELNFCNWWESKASLLFEDVSPWWEREICISAINKWDVTESVKMFFVDWLINPYTPKFIACWNEEDEKKDLWKFAKFIEGWSEKEDIVITVAPWDVVEKKAKIVFPSDYAWISKWCLISMNAEQKVVWWKINIKFRKWNIIKAVVDSSIAYDIQAKEDQEIKAKSLSVKRGGSNGTTTNSNTTTTFDWNVKPYAEFFHASWDWFNKDLSINVLFESDKMIIKESKDSWDVLIVTELKNTWNVKLKWEFYAKVTNSFWYQYFEKIGEEIINPGSSKNIEFNITDLPFYKWTFNADLQLKYIPVIEWIKGEIPEKYKKAVIENYTASFKVSPIRWWTLTLIVIVSIVIWALAALFIRKKMLSKYIKEYTIKKWDTPASIAEKHWCTSGQIVSLNSLKVPFSLKEHSIIHVYDFTKRV